MNLYLEGKTALVTGGSSGLGFACANALSEEGAIVSICSRNKESVNDAAKRIQDHTGNRVFANICDISVEQDQQDLIRDVKQQLEHIDILVFSTGHPPTFSFKETSDEDWGKGLNLVLQPAIKFTRALLEDMQKRKYGRFIFIGSIFGLEPEPDSVVQSTIRTGLNGFSKCLASQAAADGVTSNVICPGWFNTPLVQKLATKYSNETGLSEKEILEGWQNLSPTNTFGDPDDLGALAAFLASPRGKFINGRSIAIDGGLLKGY